MNLLELLSQKGIIDDEMVKVIEADAVEKGVSYEKSLLNKGLDAQTIRDAIGEHFDLPVRVITETTKLDPRVLKYIPEESAKHYRILPLSVTDGILEVGTVDPDDFEMRDALNFITTKNQIPYKLHVILEQDFEHGLISYENLIGDVGDALDEFKSELEKDLESAEGDDGDQITEHIKEDAPVTKIVATVLRYAVDGGASDIHVDPSEHKVVVRFRVDGVLLNSLELPKNIHSAVVARTKILASLRLDERRRPQDGRFSAKIDGGRIDFRVSILPTNHGEKIVIRILDTESGVRSLEETGVSPHNIELIRQAIEQPYGIILISGPTGSGKSTTLYAMLAEVDRVSKNVISLEDPVEYDIEGVSQSQIRPEIGYTFANGLRSVLRQDPDVIMVGEIRDKETAQLAIQAALTGHLVLSTIHTNNAIGVIPRLLDMGVDPYLIAPTLQLALAQRLVRRICPNSGKKLAVKGSIEMMVAEEFSDLPEKYKKSIPTAEYVLNAEPTSECANGTKGRVAVMEALQIDSEVEQLILENASEDTIYAAARKKGYLTMKEDAIIKAFEHIIPFEEVATLGGELLASDEAETVAQEIADEQGKNDTGTARTDVDAGLHIPEPVDNPVAEQV